jgi:magnesium and cobalt exporter, CNNM family
MDEVPLYEIIIFIVLIAVSGVFSGSESALISMTKLRVKKLNMNGDGGTLHRWLDNPNKYLATLLVGNNVVNICITLLAYRLTLDIFFKNSTSSTAQVEAVTVALSTFILLIFGEFVPKALCKRHAEKVSIIMIRILDVAYYLFLPVIKITQIVAHVIFFLLGQGKMKELTLITEEEVRDFIDVSEKEGILEDEEREMIHSVMDLDETHTREIMRPRVDVVALEIDASLDECFRICLESGHSRIPVYRESIDKIVGILYVKDLLRLRNGDQDSFVLKDIMREPVLVPEGKMVRDLLRELRDQKTHIAVVLDEYGGTAGLVTIEDILEEIVGEIQDEFDAEEAPALVIKKDGSWSVDAAMNLEEFQGETGIEFDRMESDSVGGYVASLAGHIPEKGENVESPCYTWTVLEGDSRRIVRLLAVHVPISEEENGES